jgi:hypothetical protein
MWYFVTEGNGTSARGLQKELGLRTYYSAWTLLHRLRMAAGTPRNMLMDTVEVDEWRVQNIAYKMRGNRREWRSLVCIMAQLNGEEIVQIRLRVVPISSRSKDLQSAVKENIARGACIQTDGLNAYKGLANYSFQVEQVTEAALVGNELLPHCRQVADQLESWLLETHGGAVRPRHLDAYLNEFVFRYDLSPVQDPRERLHQLAWRAVRTGHTTYEEYAKR